MAVLYYATVLVLSLVLLVLYVCIWNKRFDVTFTVVFTLVPVSCLAYLMQALAQNLRESVVALKILYIGGCFMQFFILMSVLNLCEIRIGRWIKILLFSFCLFLYGSVLSIGYAPFFYRSMEFSIVDGQIVIGKDYGVMHTVFQVAAVSFFVVTVCIILYSFRKKNQVSRSILYLLILPETVSLLGYLWGKSLIQGIELLPLGYLCAEFVYLLIAYRVNLYDIDDIAIDSMTQEGQTGFIAFDFKKRYLGSNDAAKQILPVLCEMTVDKVLDPEKEYGKKIRHWLDSFSQNEADHEFMYTLHPKENGEDRIYQVNVGYLYNGSRRRGYMIGLVDDTANRKYIELLDHYNEKLIEEVAEKTRHIVEMHDNLILSMATMVESRDNSTGGHIKRTSKVVAILIDEMRKDDAFPMSDEFCKNVIKAAPMHDLGKIAVDDAILRKPGKFTDEEYEKMKHHAAEGARVIHEILKHTDDEAFRIIAENVAHYHHERWDGSGYPDRLKGEEIPLEARIMAIADVYDALVSKRVYKESMSFEQADRIIMDGMGRHFDARLEKYYVKARPRLEEYYRNSEG